MSRWNTVSRVWYFTWKILICWNKNAVKLYFFDTRVYISPFLSAFLFSSVTATVLGCWITLYLLLAMELTKVRTTGWSRTPGGLGGEWKATSWCQETSRTSVESLQALVIRSFNLFMHVLKYLCISDFAWVQNYSWNERNSLFCVWVLHIFLRHFWNMLEM